MSFAERLGAFEDDLVTLEPEVVIGRLKQFLAIDLRDAIDAVSWRDLPWHVAQSCSGCDYLGYRWGKNPTKGETGISANEPEGLKPDYGVLDTNGEPLYCWGQADREKHLCRISGISRGASGKLQQNSVFSLDDLAGLSAGNKVFEEHQTLRANRTLYPARANRLLDHGMAGVADRSGTSAIMPRWSDLKVYLHTDFDVGSGLTFDLAYFIEGAKPVGRSNRGFGFEYGKLDKQSRAKFYSIKTGDIAVELEVFRTFLSDLVRDVDIASKEIDEGIRAHTPPNKKVTKKATIQFYLWDRLAFDHLCRLCGRHLDHIRDIEVDRKKIEPFLWLVPADQLLQDATFVKAESPLTILSDALGNLVAADIPHHYGLLPLANTYRRPRKDGEPHKDFRIDPFYFDPLTDQLPSERGIEMWSGRAPFRDMVPDDNISRIRWTAETRLRAMASVQSKLRDDLGEALTAEAPTVDAIMRPSQRLSGVADDLQVIRQHSRMTIAAQSLDTALLLAMPPHVREAKFRSIRLERFIDGPERAVRLDAYGMEDEVDDAQVMVLAVAERSSACKLEGRRSQRLPHAGEPSSVRQRRP